MIAVEVANLQRSMPFPRPLSRAIRASAKAALALLEMEDCELSVSIVSSRKMRVLNREERGVDKETDVLSFPFIDWTGAEPGNIAQVATERNPETGRIMLGAIVISLSRAAAQAEEIGNTLQRELGFLTIHGTLHLMGFDHMEPEDEEQMTALQRQAVSKAGIE